MIGSNETKAKSAQFQVKLPTGAELGKILSVDEMSLNVEPEKCKFGNETYEMYIVRWIHRMFNKYKRGELRRIYRGM